MNNAFLDVSRYSKGMYIMNVIGPDKMRQSIKLNKE